MKLTTYDIFIVICICLLIGIMVKLDIVMSRVQNTTQEPAQSSHRFIKKKSMKKTSQKKGATGPAIQNDLQTLYPQTMKPELKIPKIQNQNRYI